MNLSNENPREDWTLNQLGEFAQKIAKRTAHDAWLLGRAYTFAKAKAKGEGLKIEKWRKAWIPFISQPTLSRYESVAELPEDEVVGKRLVEVYRLLGLTPPKAERTKTDRPTNKFSSTTGASRTTAVSDVRSTVSDSAPSSTRSQSHGVFKVVPAAPEAERDSLLKRLATVVTLLHSVVADLPSLDITDDTTEAINDAMRLLGQIQSKLKQAA